ncbi:hypothetical protein J7E52_14460 [Bacillus sp. ISL-34]|uniref:hypothetical protein n=1 Tax=Bacillus sp. ISL-34 TaxID=2819121 RepID=UPI001BEB2802|nr:hypothetical protein [Bacillus sp. ISL-34]MBT2647883.1 hypothetical protein [Bacillus sp. ISL-34]
MDNKINFYTDDEIEKCITTRLRNAYCVFAEGEAQLLISEARTTDSLAVMVDRRVAGFPLEHIIGWADFCGIRIAVEPGVYVPGEEATYPFEINGEFQYIVEFSCYIEGDYTDTHEEFFCNWMDSPDYYPIYSLAEIYDFQQAEYEELFKMQNIEFNYMKGRPGDAYFRCDKFKEGGQLDMARSKKSPNIVGRRAPFS